MGKTIMGAIVSLDGVEKAITAAKGCAGDRVTHLLCDVSR